MSDQLPEWDGSLSWLPTLGTMFLYSGKRYRLEMCDCGCQKISAINIETEDFDLPMTIRVRGQEQGNPLTQTLVELGKTSNEVADAFEKDGLDGWLTMRQELLAQDPVGAGKITQPRLDYLVVETLATMGY